VLGGRVEEVIARIPRGEFIFCAWNGIDGVHCAQEDSTYKPTIHDINALLDELATHSKFAQLPDTEGSVPKRSQLAVLNDLYRTATPDEASLITQIILKDLRPIVSPLKIVHTTTNLLRKKPANVPLTVWQALKIWHPTLPALYRVYASIPEVFNVLENGTSAQLEPILGIPIQVNSRV
jgi:DNA ligase 4